MGSRSTALPIPILYARGKWVAKFTPLSPNTRQRPGTHSNRGWVGLEVSLDGYRKSPFRTWVRTPARPVCSGSIYKLRYPACDSTDYYWKGKTERKMREATYVKHNIARSSYNHCFCGKAISVIRYILCVCVCSLRYPACKAHSPYCHVSCQAVRYFSL